MDKIKIKYKDLQLDFGMNEIKFIKSTDFNRDFYFIQCMRKKFNKVDSSEYQNEQEVKDIFTVNGAEPQYSKKHLYIIDPFFDWDKDIKLGAKSITLKYLDSFFESIEFNELAITINNLINDLSEEVSNDITNILGKDIWVKIKGIDQKNATKNVEINYMDEDLIQNQFDFSYDEMIKLQIKMINQISKSNKLISNWVLMSIPVVTEAIYNEIDKTLKNQKYIILSKNVKVHMMNEETVWMGQHKTIDLADDVQIYNEFLMDYPEHIELDTAKELLNNFINETDKEIIEKLTKLM